MEGLKTHKTTLIPGDGIGPEVIDVARQAIERSGVSIEWHVIEDALDIESIIASVKNTKTGLKGPVSTPVGEGHQSVNVRLRRALDAYANVRPVKSFDGVNSRYKNVDFIIVRENLEDLYAGIEFGAEEKGAAELRDVLGRYFPRLSDDSAISIKPVSFSESKRVARFAFEYAKEHGRSKVTVVHKANIMKQTDGLFRRAASETAENYPDIEFEDKIVDAVAMQLVKDPASFDVLLCPNLYGDILSDSAAGLIGGLGLAPGANIGDNYAVFEAVHGTAPDIAGQNKANPISIVLSAAMMLYYLNEKEAASKIENAVKNLLQEGKFLTGDIAQDGQESVTTSELARRLYSFL